MTPMCSVSRVKVSSMFKEMKPPLHIGREESTLPSWEEADRRMRESGPRLESEPPKS